MYCTYYEVYKTNNDFSGIELTNDLIPNVDCYYSYYFFYVFKSI